MWSPICKWWGILDNESESVLLPNAHNWPPDAMLPQETLFKTQPA